MLIIPVERGIDWRRPPLATGFIILLCVVIYVSWQWQDQRRIQQAIQFYSNSDLLPLEYPNYLSHLHQSYRVADASRIEAWKQSGEDTIIVAHIVWDRSFTQTISQTGVDFWGEDVYQRWRDARTRFNALQNNISSFRLGLIPEDSRWLTYLSYQFLHGSTLHLIGNMMVLALVGIAVEAAMGSMRFLLCYLLCGVLAGLTHTLFHWHSQVPLVGASGSISAVMGMYVVLYGWRRIRFFYSLVFYFGYFHAPALILLPVWLLWEGIHAIWGSQDSIAYLAHAGGLVSGGLIMLLGRKQLLQVEETYLDALPDDDLTFRMALDDFLKQMAALNFDSARRKLAQLESDYPDHHRVLQHRYYLEKLDSGSEAYHRFTHQLLNRPGHDTATLHLLLDVYQDYSANETPQLAPELMIKLMLNFCQLEAWETVESLIKQAQQLRLRHPMLVKILRQLGKGLQQQGESHMGRQYLDLADSLANG